MCFEDISKKELEKRRFSDWFLFLQQIACYLNFDYKENKVNRCKLINYQINLVCDFSDMQNYEGIRKICLSKRRLSKLLTLSQQTAC